MAYIGKSPALGNFVKLDAISVVNGQAAYTMQNGSVNFTDYSTVNQFLVSLNGVIQAPTSSFTVSGSTLTFASNLATGDVIDFIMVFGNSLSAGTPTDGTVTTAKLASTSVTAAKLNNDIISGTTALTSEPADTDEFLVSDAGTLKRIDYSLIKGGGITMAEQWRLSTILTCSTTDTDVDVTANLEKVDTDSPGTIGSSMTESSGVFSFPSTGVYLILNNYMFYNGSSSSSYNGLITRVTTDNSSYSYATENYVGVNSNYNNGSSAFIFDVTNTSTHKVKFTYFVNSSVTLRGSTSNNMTSFSFIRLGDT
jgi:hypothetical protein